MTTIALDDPSAPRPPAPQTRDEGPAAAPTGSTRSRTLDDAVSAVWHDLGVCGEAPCPVCGGTLTLESGHDTAQCAECGSRLA